MFISIRYIFLGVLLTTSLSAYTQVGIGTTSPLGSAQLDVTSTSKGFLPPRMTSGQRSAITAPVAGLMVYQTDGTTGLYYYNGTTWIYIINSTNNILPVANGGTGQTTASASLNALLPAQTGNANKVLVTDGTNTSWATNVALTSAVIGTLNTSGANIGSNASTGSYIDLPNGKWSVQVTMLARVSSSSFAGNYWVRTFFSAVADNSTITTDCVGPSLVSGLIQGGTKYNMLSGTLIINNTSGSTKRYFYRTAGMDVFDGGDPLVTLSNFGKSLWGENSIVAYPMN